jgi:ComF family protein
MATAIARFKYGDRADLAPRLGRSLLLAASRLEGAVDVVLPIPLHPRRLAERGYNHAALLADPVARSLSVPLEPSAVSRVRHTQRQASLDRHHRILNVVGAFRVRDRALLKGARVLLVDDVRTTGATLEACAATLHEAGARQVLALVLALRA